MTALVESLHVASTGLKTGAIDQTTAHKMVAGAFAVAWEAGGAAVVSVTMAAIAATATAYAPAPPHIKALITVGTGVVGFLIEGTIGNSKLYDQLGKLTADALFWSGSKVSEVGTALSNLLSTIMDAAAAALNPFDRNPYKDLDLSTFDAFPGDDDVEGIAVEFTNYGAFQNVAPEQVTLQTAFYRSADGPGWVTDEPIAGRMLDPRGTEPEPLFIDAPIG